MRRKRLEPGAASRAFGAGSAARQEARRPSAPIAEEGGPAWMMRSPDGS